jgi:hypothetical protein
MTKGALTRRMLVLGGGAFLLAGCSILAAA